MPRPLPQRNVEGRAQSQAQAAELPRASAHCCLEVSVNRGLRSVAGSGLKVPGMGVARRGGAMDARVRPSNRVLGTAESASQPETRSPSRRTSPPHDSGSFNAESLEARLSRLRHTGDAAPKMGEPPSSQSCDQQEPRSTTAQLVRQLQQLEFQRQAASPPSHGYADNTHSRSRSINSSSLHSESTTQTPGGLMAQSLRTRSTQSTFAQELQDMALLHSSAHWTSGVRLLAGSRLFMWDQDKANQQPPSLDNLQLTQQPVDSDSLPTPFQYGQDRRTVFAMENQPLGNSEQKSEDMEDDALLDDASLDMLVTTLARETARIEAAHGTKSGHMNSGSVLLDNEDEDEHENQQSSELDHADDSDFSSATSSNPSTPSTSSSGKSLLRVGKAKAKPKRVRRACVVPGCGKRSRSLGLCIAHGGGRRCIVAGCDKSSQGGNLCIKHGGGKRCSVDGCEKAAQTNSLCKAHGGGPRCQYGNCEKSSQGGGFCRQHGGGKRCAFPGCMKGTQRGSYCALHGGSRLCVVDGCRRNDRGGGFCAHHGGGRRCTVPMCTRPSRRNALCSTHLRVLGKDGHNLDELNESIELGIRRTLASRTPSPTPSSSPPPASKPNLPTQR